MEWQENDGEITSVPGGSRNTEQLGSYLLYDYEKKHLAFIVLDCADSRICPRVFPRRNEMDGDQAGHPEV